MKSVIIIVLALLSMFSQAQRRIIVAGPGIGKNVADYSQRAARSLYGHLPVGSAGIPAAPGTITQPAYACAGSSGNIYSITAVSGAISYTWSVSGAGWSVTAGGTTTTATITIGSSDGAVSVTETNNFGTSAPSTTGTIIPMAAPETPAAITGTFTVCVGLTTQLADIISNGEWSSGTTGVATISDDGLVTGVTTGTSLISYTIANGCGSGTVTQTITVDPISVGGSIAGSATVCSGTNSTLLTLSGYTGSITKWQKSTDNWVTPVDITNTVNTYTATNLTTTTKYRAVITSGVCSSANSADAIVTVVTTPAIPGTINGIVSQCAGATGQTYSITAVTYATTYTWNAPTGWSITAGSGTISITVTAGTAGQNGNITVTAGNSCGTSSARELAVTSVAYETEACGLFARMTTEPTGERKSLINTLIINAKAHGWWALADCFQVYAAHNSQAALLNWIKNSSNGTLVNAPTFTTDRGFVFNGLASPNASYINTNYNPALDKVNFAARNASFGIYCLSAGATDLAAGCGVKIANNWVVILPKFSGFTYAPVNWSGYRVDVQNYISSRAYIFGINNATNTFVYRNGVNVTTERTNGTFTNPPPNGNIFIGGCNFDGVCVNNIIREYPVFYIGAALTITEAVSFQNDVEDYLMPLGLAVTYKQVFNYNDFDHRITTSSLRHNPFASLKFTTKSDTIYIKADPQLTSYPTWNEIRVSIDGAISYISIADSSTKYMIIAGGGTTTKTIELTESGTSTQGGVNQLGCFLTSIELKRSTNIYTPIKETPTKSVCFIGNSITVGANATHLQTGYPMIVRDSGYYSSTIGYGYASLYSVAGTTTLSGILAHKVDTLLNGSSTNILFICLGTNDYGLNTVDTVNFLAHYNVMLDSLYSVNPTISIKCVTPILRGTETANSWNATLTAYRRQIYSACVGRGYCTAIDGTAIVTLGDLGVDELHPTTAGQLKMGRYFLDNYVK